MQLPWKELYLQFVVILELLLTISLDNSVLPPLLEDFRDPSDQGTTTLIPNETIPLQPYQFLPPLKMHSCTSYTRTPSYNPQMNNNHNNLKYNFELERIFSVLSCTILLTSGHNLKLNRVGQRGIPKSVFYHYSILLAIFKFYIVKLKHCNRGCQISCPTHR